MTLTVLISRYVRAYLCQMHGDHHPNSSIIAVSLATHYPAPHSSPRNNIIWLRRNSRLEKEVIPRLQARVCVFVKTLTLAEE